MLSRLGGSTAYQLAAAFRLAGRLNLAALAEAWADPEVVRWTAATAARLATAPQSLPVGIFSVIETTGVGAVTSGAAAPTVTGSMLTLLLATTELQQASS